MRLNVRCPRCGSRRVQCSNERSKNGCFWFFLIGFPYVLFVLLKWMVGLFLLVCFDWWIAILRRSIGRGYVFRSLRLFSGTKRIFFCHDCGYNFRY